MLTAMLMAGYADDPYVYPLWPCPFPSIFKVIISNCLIISTCLLDIYLYGRQTPQSQHHLNYARQISFRPALSPLTPLFFLCAQLRNCGIVLCSFV